MKEDFNIDELSRLMEKILLISNDSPIYKKLAAYINKNYQHIIFMTASEVAVSAEVSQGSVSRFCISLGYRGYTDFLHSLQKFVRKGITAPQRLEYTSNSEKNVTNILQMEHKNIDELQGIINQSSYAQLVDDLVSAKQLYFISTRMSATLLPYLCYILNKIRNNVFQVTPNSPIWDTMELLNTSDVQIVTIMFPRYPNQLLNKLSNLKERGFKISAVTDSIMSPITGLADNTVVVPITTSSIFDIYSTPILLLNLLMRDVARKTKGLDIRMRSFEELDKKNNTYLL